ncbi:hypothetical protein [Gymnodinialimonas ulvae]|uniref:hypothetical protein n=1 Tax=Gymnodinialimonas ulvae TaxID=3126504 RepID=UPI0030ACD612
MVYLGTDAPVDGFGEVAPDEVGLAPEVEHRPAALTDKARVMRVADRTPEGWNCSCVFGCSGYPPDMVEEDDPEALAARRAAFAALRAIAQAALAVDPVALVFSCTSGEEAGAVRVTRHLAVCDLQPDTGVFDDIEGLGQFSEPPVLIHLRAAGP